MANSKVLATPTLLLALNILFFTLVSSTGTCPPPKSPKAPSPPAAGTCPMDALKLGVCADLLNDLIGHSSEKPLLQLA
ncbi:hypothetical protein Nepgr_030866 [Nepenthes gracilis]|uniref:Uncharacterized protein n=1 Tax=Nepenthes gracilis TaxID=150966 RepID=A0AAD3Y4M9_NEPGR|nr:hypothetical protein Nepgr_030866 [Nepenthes gracilis]